MGTARKTLREVRERDPGASVSGSSEWLACCRGIGTCGGGATRNGERDGLAPIAGCEKTAAGRGAVVPSREGSVSQGAFATLSAFFLAASGSGLS